MSRVAAGASRNFGVRSPLIVFQLSLNFLNREIICPCMRPKHERGTYEHHPYMANIKRRAPASAAVPVSKRAATSNARNASGKKKFSPITVDSDFEDDEEEEEEPQLANRMGNKSQSQKKAQPTGSK